MPLFFKFVSTTTIQFYVREITLVKNTLYITNAPQIEEVKVGLETLVVISSLAACDMSMRRPLESDSII